MLLLVYTVTVLARADDDHQEDDAEVVDVSGISIPGYADDAGENARTFCDYLSPYFNPVTVYGVLGHMHELGRSFRMELNPDGESPLLLDIPRWDFYWQDRYEFVEPVQISFGSVLRMSCTWDNSLSDDPRYVVWGEGTADEMCFATVMVLKT